MKKMGILISFLLIVANLLLISITFAQDDMCKVNLDALSALLESAREELEEENIEEARTFIELAEDIVAETQECLGEKETSQITFTISVPNANLRIPPMSGTVVGTLSQGTSQDATGYVNCPDGIWLRTRYEQRDVWLRSDLVDLSDDVSLLPLIDIECGSSVPPTPTTIGDPPPQESNITTPTCTSDIRFCTSVVSIQVNGTTIAPGQRVPAGAVNFQNVTFTVSAQNLGVIGSQAGLNYVYAQVIPLVGETEIWSVEPQATPKGSAIDPLFSGTLSLGINDVSWEPESPWQRYLVLIIHYNASTEREEVIGSALVLAN
jgi:hypothetical protein